MRKLLLLLLLLDLFHSISFIFYLLVSVASMPLCTGKWPFHPLRTLSFETVMELDNCTGSMPSNCIKYNSCWNVTHHNASYRHRIVFCWYYLLICYCYASFLVVLWGHGQTDGRTDVHMHGWMALLVRVESFVKWNSSSLCANEDGGGTLSSMELYEVHLSLMSECFVLSIRPSARHTTCMTVRVGGVR